MTATAELLAVAPEIFLAEVIAVVEQTIRGTRVAISLAIPELAEDRRRRRLQSLAGRTIAGYQEIRWEQDRLRAVTNPITVRDSHGESHDLGQFLVEIDPGSPTPYVRGWRAGRAVDARHPHVNGGRICYGNYRGQIQLVIESEVYEALLIYTGEILDSYNPGSPYWRLEQPCGCGSRAERRRCRHCQRTWGCEACSLRLCVGCAQFACERCRATCSVCQNPVCHTCRQAGPTGLWICPRCQQRQQRRRQVA